MNDLYSLTGKYIPRKYFTYRSVQIFKILFQGFYTPKSDSNRHKCVGWKLCVPAGVPFPTGISAGPALKYFYMIHRVLAIEKIGDWKKLEILVQNQSFWNIVGARPTAAPRNSGRDNAAGILIIWWSSPPRILQIHSLHQFAMSTPFHVPLRRRGISITIFDGFGTNCMVHYNWDSAPRCNCSPNFISDLRVEFLLKTDSGYLRDAEVTWFTLANP